MLIRNYEQSIRCQLDNLTAALCYLEQSTGTEIPTTIYDMIASLERTIFSEGEDSAERQFELQFADPDSLD